MLAELFLGKQLEPFLYPLIPIPRTAVLVPWFGEPRGAIGLRSAYSPDVSIRLFPRGWCAEAESFTPASIAATVPQLVELGQAAFGRPTPKLTHAVVVLARPGDAALAEGQRDWLWRKFRVPVFEQIIGSKGETIATECEAHDGMHVGMHVGTGITALEALLKGETVEESPCACGRRSPRIRVPKGAVLEHRVAAWAR
ncbi:MAG: hypothetical protein ABL967_03020 [Bryobacteraceae bacterium]